GGAGRFGEERVLLASLVLLAVGLFARGAWPEVLLFPGTVVAGAAIALMNVLLPSLVKRRRPDQAGLLIGVYLLSLAARAILSSLLAASGHQSSGGSSPSSAGLCGLPALAAVLDRLSRVALPDAPPPPDPPPAG